MPRIYIKHPRNSLEILILTLAGALEFASNSYYLARMGKTHFHL